jgi:hypothetical protein
VRRGRNAGGQRCRDPAATDAGGGEPRAVGPGPPPGAPWRPSRSLCYFGERRGGLPGPSPLVRPGRASEEGFCSRRGGSAGVGRWRDNNLGGDNNLGEQLRLLAGPVALGLLCEPPPGGVGGVGGNTTSCRSGEEQVSEAAPAGEQRFSRPEPCSLWGAWRHRGAGQPRVPRALLQGFPRGRGCRQAEERERPPPAPQGCPTEGSSGPGPLGRGPGEPRGGGWWRGCPHGCPPGPSHPRPSGSSRGALRAAAAGSGPRASCEVSLCPRGGHRGVRNARFGRLRRCGRLQFPRALQLPPAVSAPRQCAAWCGAPQGGPLGQRGIRPDEQPGRISGGSWCRRLHVALSLWRGGSVSPIFSINCVCACVRRHREAPRQP